MKTGWIAKIEDAQTQDRIFTLLACSRRAALERCAELRKKNDTMKVELVGPYSEITESAREVKVITSDDLTTVFKDYADLNPLLISREGNNFQIEVDKLA